MRGRGGRARCWWWLEQVPPAAAYVAAAGARRPSGAPGRAARVARLRGTHGSGDRVASLSVGTPATRRICSR